LDPNSGFTILLGDHIIGTLIGYCYTAENVKKLLVAAVVEGSRGWTKNSFWANGIAITLHEPRGWRGFVKGEKQTLSFTVVQTPLVMSTLILECIQSLLIACRGIVKVPVATQSFGRTPRTPQARPETAPASSTRVENKRERRQVVRLDPSPLSKTKKNNAAPVAVSEETESEESTKPRARRRSQGTRTKKRIKPSSDVPDKDPDHSDQAPPDQPPPDDTQQQPALPTQANVEADQLRDELATERKRRVEADQLRDELATERKRRVEAEQRCVAAEQKRNQDASKATAEDAMDAAMRQLRGVGAFLAEAQRLGLSPAPTPVPVMVAPGAKWTPDNLVALVKAAQPAPSPAPMELLQAIFKLHPSRL
jgi:hypothetical protein